MEKMSFHIEGVNQTIMHNGQLADPLNYWAKEMKRVHSKRKKSDADHEELAELEFKGGLYLLDDDDKKPNKGKNPCWPADNILAMLRSAGRLKRLGKNVEMGLAIREDSPLIYKGPKDRDGLWKDSRYHFRKRVALRGSSVMRTRCRFPEWQLKFDILYMPDIWNPDDLTDVVVEAGQYIGLSDWQRRYGMYEVLKTA